MALLFALSRFGFIPNFSSLPSRFFIRRTYFAFFVFFKWGVKFPTCTQFREAITFPFCSHSIFLVLSEPHYLLLFHDIFGFITYAHRSALHDIYDCTAMPFFCCATIFMIAPRCHLLLRYDIYDCTAMLSFVAPRYLWLHHDAIFCCTTIFMIAPRCPSFETPR